MLACGNIHIREKLNGETEQWTVTPTSITQKDSKLVVTSSCYAFSKYSNVVTLAKHRAFSVKVEFSISTVIEFGAIIP